MGLPGSRPGVWCSSGDDDLLLRCWLAWGQAAARLRERASRNRCDWRRLRGGRPARCCTAGRRAPGLLARGRLPGTGKAGIRPGEPGHRHRCCGGAHSLQGARRAWARCRDPRWAPRLRALA